MANEDRKRRLLQAAAQHRLRVRDRNKTLTTPAEPPSSTPNTITPRAKVPKKSGPPSALDPFKLREPAYKKLNNRNVERS